MAKWIVVFADHRFQIGIYSDWYVYDRIYTLYTILNIDVTIIRS